MNQKFIARSDISIRAPATKVWEALVNPQMIRQYMFGTNAISDWKRGSPIVFKGEWQGRTYEDKGVILRFEPERLLEYSHFSPLAGLPDTPENYHTVTIELSQAGPTTVLALSQDNNPTDEARQHSERNWSTMLATLKKLLESK